MHIVKTCLSFFTAVLLSTTTTLVLAQTCNPNIPLTKPDSRYAFNSAGDEVTDTVTGLIWKRCAEGMVWSGGTCAGTATPFTWYGALAQTAFFSDYTGVAWRMPNLKELESLVETACYDMAINQTAFPATQRYAWSASPYVAGIDGAWAAYFYNGYDYWSVKSSAKFWLRLVR